MGTFKQSVKDLLKKLQFNPVSMGGNTIYVSTLGIVLGFIVMLIVTVYAIGKFSVLESAQNVVTNAYIYQNDPYQINLSDWNMQVSIYEELSGRYVNADNMFSMGLNVTVWNVVGEESQKKNPSKLINSQKDRNKMRIDYGATPFVVAGSSYVHQSPDIKEFLMEVRFCQAGADPRCSQRQDRKYSIQVYMEPKWASLGNPKQPGILEMHYIQRIKIDRTKIVTKYQLIYDVSGFNVTSDTSLMPNFIPRKKQHENGSELAGPPMKIYLPQQSKNVGELWFRRSGVSKAYTRKFNSIDVIFAQILGVVALFGLILWVLFAHYNLWGSQQFIIRKVEGSSQPVNLFQYIKFYLTCKKRTKKQQKILEQAHQDIVQAYKERKRRKVQLQITKLRLEKIEAVLNLKGNEERCKQQILQRLKEQEKDELFSSSILTQEIRTSLLKQ